MSRSHHCPRPFRFHPLAAALRRARLPLLAGGALLCLAGPAFGAPVEVELSGIVAGDDGGFALNGATAGDYSGIVVSAAGDVNGDGIDDVIVGAQRTDPNGDKRGQSCVVYGSDTTPDALVIPGRSGTFPGTLATSDTVTVTGFDTTTLIS